MKIKAHIRVAKDPKGRTSPKVVATARPNTHPLAKADGSPLPTVSFAVEFDVPDAMFKQAEQIIATITIPESQAQIACDVREVESAQ